MDTVIYSLPARRFLRVASVLGQNRYVIYNLPHWSGHYASEAEADLHVADANGVAEWGGQVYHVDTYAESSPDTYEWRLLYDLSRAGPRPAGAAAGRGRTTEGLEDGRGRRSRMAR